MEAENSPRQPSDLDTSSLARMTRKTIDRLAPFCQMRYASSSSEGTVPDSAQAASIQMTITTSPSVSRASSGAIIPTPDPNKIITKIHTKIHTYIRAIDGSMLSAQAGYALAVEGMLHCDPGVQQGEWGVVDAVAETDGGKEEKDNGALKKLAEKGWEHAHTANEIFQDVRQDMYKIAALTKDSTALVLLPPEAGQPSTMRKPLKEVGTDLVANLNLLSQFTGSIYNLLEWWSWMKDALTRTGGPSAAVASPSSQGEGDLTYAQWEQIKRGFQEYYNVVNVLYVRYPELLRMSSNAWQAVTSPQSVRSTAANSVVNSRDPSVHSTNLTNAAGWKVRSTGGFMRFGRSKDKSASDPEKRQASEYRSASAEGSARSSARHSPESGGHRTQEHEARQKPALKKRASSLLLNGIRHLGCLGCLIP